MRKTIETNLHDGQRYVLLDEHKFKIICTGRQWGKTWLASVFVVRKALAKPNSRVWITAPTYSQASQLFQMAVLFCQEHDIPISVTRSKENMAVTLLYNNSKIEAKSTQNPDNLRGATLDALVVDEAAMIPNGIFEEHLYPMTTVKDADIVVISTPKSKNWFYDYYNMGHEDNSVYKSFHFTSYDSPFQSKDRLDFIKEHTTETIFRQEYLAEFIDAGGEVFQRYTTRPLSKTPVEGMPYVCGLDLAIHTDYTVLTVFEHETGIPVDMLRMKDLTWTTQIYEIKEFLKSYNFPPIFADATGIGNPVCEMLINDGMDIHPVTFTAKKKQELIQNLAVMLQREDIYLPDDRIVIDEFDRYQYEISPSGNFKYSAPSGYHDDCVCSIALAAYGMANHAVGVGFVFDEPLLAICTDEEMYDDLGLIDDDDAEWSRLFPDEENDNIFGV